jgi:transglutaminase-like putative cysteine protease
MIRFVVYALLVTSPLGAAEPKSRTFKFTYEGTVTGLAPGQQARIWVPVPPSNDDQEILRIVKRVGANVGMHTESEFGNKVFHFASKADADGNIPFTFVYTVERREVLGETDKSLTNGLDRFLKPDPLAPPDGKHLELIAGKKLPTDSMAKARQLYELVNNLMHYAKQGADWGRGDVNWVCDSRFGNCTDFHSLFNALARSQKIPAKFEIGFGIPTKRGMGDVPGYHCWAKFKPEGKGWVPVDISEANKNPKLSDYFFGNLTEDRVTFSTGRGLILSPKQDGPPLNFFVYPYVEVDGKPYPADKVKRRFAYEDVK